MGSIGPAPRTSAARFIFEHEAAPSPDRIVTSQPPSGSTPDGMLEERGKRSPTPPEGLDCPETLPRHPAGLGAGTFEPEDGRIGHLPSGSITAARLPQYCLISHLVEDVVGDLEREAEGLSEHRETSLQRGSGPRRDPADAHARPQEGSGLALVDGLGVAEVRSLSFLPLEVEHLSPDHTGCPGGMGYLGDQVRDDPSPGPPISAGDHTECLGQQGISRQDGRSLSESLVQGRFPAAHVVVIHRGKIIVGK